VGDVFDIMRDLDVGHVFGMVEGLDLQGGDGAGTAWGPGGGLTVLLRLHGLWRVVRHLQDGWAM